MLFLSRGKSPSVLMVPGFEEIVQTTHGNIPRVKKPIWLKFTPSTVPFEAPGLPTKWKTGKAWGYLDSKHAARQAGVDEEELKDFLLNHPDHGVDFIGVAEGGDEIGSDERFFVPEGEAGFFCKLCNRHLQSSQAKAGHQRSKEHEEHVKEAEGRLREKLASV